MDPRLLLEGDLLGVLLMNWPLEGLDVLLPPYEGRFNVFGVRDPDGCSSKLEWLGLYLFFAIDTSLSRTLDFRLPTLFIPILI